MPGQALDDFMEFLRRLRLTERMLRPGQGAGRIPECALFFGR